MAHQVPVLLGEPGEEAGDGEHEGAEGEHLGGGGGPGDACGTISLEFIFNESSDSFLFGKKKKVDWNDCALGGVGWVTRGLLKLSAATPMKRRVVEKVATKAGPTRTCRGACRTVLAHVRMLVLLIRFKRY